MLWIVVIFQRIGLVQDPDAAAPEGGCLAHMGWRRESIVPGVMIQTGEILT